MDDLPSTMPAAVYRGPGQVAVEERAVKSPGPGEVLVEVDHCGICGSDIHLMLEGWGTPGRVEGHEWTGRVVALGDGVAQWAVGDAVVGGPSPRCGECRRCRAGKPSQCERRERSIADAFDGAFARYVRTGAGSLLRLPDGLDGRRAALAEPLAVALHAITRSRLEPGDTAMIFGAGPIGALALAALVARGFDSVLVVEPGARRRRLAESLGAAAVLDPTELEVFPQWQPERLVARPVDAVLECSGRRDAMQAGFNQLGRGGVLVLVGAGMEAPSFDPNRMILNELEVCGSFVYDDGGFDDALALLASGAIPTDLLIEPEDVPLEGIGEALRALAEGRVAGKALVVPRLGHEGQEAR
jgi:(R,R)-butanediol dehydrogenase / meso-butanediol dehydrogenase / diacetyl reductase